MPAASVAKADINSSMQKSMQIFKHLYFQVARTLMELFCCLQHSLDLVQTDYDLILNLPLLALSRSKCKGLRSFRSIQRRNERLPTMHRSH